jgi:hypothetical protein
MLLTGDVVLAPWRPRNGEGWLKTERRRGHSSSAASRVRLSVPPASTSHRMVASVPEGAS